MGTQKEKTPRRKWHERTAEKDIRYRGPLNYQHFQILGWLCIVASQALLLLGLGARLGTLPESYAGFVEPMAYMSWLSLPFLLIANFAQIMNGQKSYRFLLIKNFCAAGAIWGIYAFFLHRYVLGTIDMINDGAITSIEALSQIMEKATSTGVLSFNIFIDLFLCTLVMFFLNVRPKRFFTGKKRYFVRAMAILPVAYEACSIYLKGQAATGKILLPFWTFPLLTVKPPMTFMVFMVLVLYIKQREWRFRRHGKKHAEYRAFLKTNRNSLQFSIFLAVVLVVAAILDFVIMVFLTASAAVEASSAEVFAGSEAEVVRMMAGAMAMGFGDAVSLLFVAPLVLLFSYTRVPKNKMLSAVIPVAAIVLMIIFLFEGAYQGFSYLAKEVPHMSMREIVDLITIEIPGLAQVVH